MFLKYYDLKLSFTRFIPQESSVERSEAMKTHYNTILHRNKNDPCNIHSTTDVLFHEL